MQKPTPDSIDLVRTFMDDASEPLVKYLALMMGSVMEHNYIAVTELLEQRRGQFEEAGAGEQFGDLELELRALFEPFLNTQDGES